MTFDADDLRQHIPYYLTAAPDQKVLLTELKKLIEGADRGYFVPAGYDGYTAEMLQGDGWRGFQIFSFKSGNLKMARGIVLSNSCDVSDENTRVLPPNVTFAPIVKLSKIVERFEAHGLDGEKVASRLTDIKAQRVTNMFYIPADGPLDEDHVALLDDLHSMPIEVHRSEAEKLFTLSMAGFYLFVFKLSVHFCRLHEKVNRKPTQVAG
ncbi:hypothetical protein [Histidinibacterium lentulum]|uniref:Uncharacterized protein n=1 Tax=Histidinibacterium lentulum TaxID=2480588 RepID=A0A3N2R7Q7_9RHOB|nr:hypothetical protein [Histidinibacterium lentulum]ROU03475.1 hypothetical protein EAT49_04035 [Histidinibacterium lentulum]